MGTRVLPEGKVAGRETNDAPPSSAEAKNEWSHASAVPMCLQDVNVYWYSVRSIHSHL
jgi:hypothetical protein